MLADVHRRRAAHLERLAFYQANAAKNYPDPATVGGEDLGAFLVLRGGVLAERAGIAWCDEILQTLEAER